MTRTQEINPCDALRFLSAPVALGGKNGPGVHLEKIFFSCEPERIDHGDFKDSNFEDDRQTHK